ncbi:MAG: M14 family zinc carboxypeptidase [Rubricoccaceae bacterium]|nr:M14 family zinc carboxypeptidase [Rubricoccaceae bacterium]
MPHACRRLLPVLLALLAVPVVAQAPEQEAPERYAEVLLPLPAPGAEARPAARLAERLAAAGVHLDHARIETTDQGPALRTVLSESELAIARAAGLDAEVLVEDLAAAVSARPTLTAAERAAALAAGGIQGNIFGSMGGFPTFTEALAILDDMRAQYPDLISARLSLGQSHEGRDIWMVEVSDNPGVDEDEPEVLITSLHHAREPAGLTTVLYTLWYLLENYDSDAQIRYLVNNRRLFVVPILNPDGYVYNETTDPNGGGFWRKNRRVNGGGSRGVDLNRNYGYLWGYDNIGSSGSPFSDTYRGPAPFSEPELVALRDFLEGGRSVRAAFNYHTYGDLLLFPWGYRVEYTPDHNLFVAASQRLTAANGYTYGIGPEILYPVNGDSDDWMYGEQTTKPKIFSFTPEVGPSFWPSSSQIVPLAQENLEANLLLLYLSGRQQAGAAGEGIAFGEAAATEAPARLGAPYPNPATEASTVAFTLPEAERVRLSVHDVLGREVAVLVDAEVEAGRHEALLVGAALPAGTYLVRLTAGGQVETQRVVIAR